MDAELLELLTDTVTVYPCTGDDAYSAPQYSATGTEYPCRIEHRNRLTVDRQGREVVSGTTVYIGQNSAGAFPGLETRDRMVLSDGDSPEILSIVKLKDETGAVYYEAAYCG